MKSSHKNILCFYVFHHSDHVKIVTIEHLFLISRILVDDNSYKHMIADDNSYEHALVDDNSYEHVSVNDTLTF